MGNLTLPGPLVETDWLAGHLADPQLRIYDCTVWLRPDPPRVYRVESGRADFDAGHIPRSGFLDLPGELSDPDAGLNFMMPAPDVLGARLAARGIGDDTPVVLYSRDTVQWATRVWWMLRAIGFDNAGVLNGGFDKWQAEARAVATETPDYPAGTLTVRPRPDLFCDKHAVRAAMDDGATCILNALRPDQHDGSAPVNYGRPGRIPGSVNVPGIHLIDPDTKAYRPIAEIKALLGESGALSSELVVVYCGGGIAATNDAFILTLLGRDNVTVYDASMSEWANDPEMPMETG